VGSKKRKRRSKDALRKLIEALILGEEGISVAELVGRIRSRYNIEVREEEIVEIVKSLEEEGKIDLNPPSVKVSSYAEYLGMKTENTWFYLMLGVVIGTMLSIYLLPTSLPWVVIRWVIGSIFVLYLPGFVTIEALFPRKKEISGLERLALSLGLSISIVPLIGLLLNYTPWGIRLTPVTFSLSIFTLLMGLVASYRKYKVAIAER